MTSRRVVRGVAGILVAGALGFGVRAAEAHLMAAGRGTVNVVGAGVFTVLSVPASALLDADDDHDGLLDLGELERHQDALRAEIDRRLVIRDGEKRARTVRIDLLLSPDHGAPTDRAAHVVALEHVEFDTPPINLNVACDLFGARGSDRSLTIAATRAASGEESDDAVFTPEAPRHAFFPVRPSPVAVGAGGAGRGGLVMGALFAVVVAMAWWRNTRKGFARR